MEKEKNFIFQWLYTTSLFKFCRASFNSTWFSAKRRLFLLAVVVGLFFWAAGAVVIGVVAQPPSMGKKIRLNILRLISKTSWLQSLWPLILEWLVTGGLCNFYTFPLSLFGGGGGIRCANGQGWSDGQSFAFSKLQKHFWLVPWTTVLFLQTFVWEMESKSLVRVSISKLFFWVLWSCPIRSCTR